jgi:hypothetical protein
VILPSILLFSCNCVPAATAASEGEINPRYAASITFLPFYTGRLGIGLQIAQGTTKKQDKNFRSHLQQLALLMKE